MPLSLSLHLFCLNEVDATNEKYFILRSNEAQTSNLLNRRTATEFFSLFLWLDWSSTSFSGNNFDSSILLYFTLIFTREYYVQCLNVKFDNKIWFHTLPPAASGFFPHRMCVLGYLLRSNRKMNGEMLSTFPILYFVLWRIWQKLFYDYVGAFSYTLPSLCFFSNVIYFFCSLVQIEPTYFCTFFFVLGARLFYLACSHLSFHVSWQFIFMHKHQFALSSQKWIASWKKLRLINKMISLNQKKKMKNGRKKKIPSKNFWIKKIIRNKKRTNRRT